MEKLKSCIDGEPFTKLEENGKASILNYNLPQATCYDATSFLGLDLDRRIFKSNQSSKPANDYWDLIPKISKAELLSKLEKNIAIAPGVSLIQNIEAIRHSTIQEKAASAEKPFSVRMLTLDKRASTALPEDYLTVSNYMGEGYMPVLQYRLSRLPEILYLPKPKTIDPQISIVLHLKMCSYLGDYGAGKTVKTFSLLPGEKTTISIRSYEYKEVIKHLAENVLDSYSESSAEDLQTSIEEEREHVTNLNRTDTMSKTGNWKAGGSAGLNLGFVKIGGGGGGGGSSASSTTVNEAIRDQVSILVNNTSRHTSKADSLREIEINTSTTSTSIAEDQKTIIRELTNINTSRVLNFVFRQLLQEFISITYIHDVSFVYSNGYPSQRRSCKLSGLENMLGEILTNNTAIKNTLNMIYTQLCSITDHQGDQKSLIEKVSYKAGNCISGGKKEDVEYVRVKKDLRQEYKGKTVNGIILDTTHRIIRTPSLIAEALLGQGEAHDCYNMRKQQEASMKDQLENARTKQALDIIDALEDPSEKANLYKKVFGGYEEDYMDDEEMDY